MNRLTAFSLLAFSTSPVFAGSDPITPIPEPSTMALMGAGVAVALYFAKKRKK